MTSVTSQAFEVKLVFPVKLLFNYHNFMIFRCTIKQICLCIRSVDFCTTLKIKLYLFSILQEKLRKLSVLNMTISCLNYFSARRNVYIFSIILKREDSQVDNSHCVVKFSVRSVTLFPCSRRNANYLVYVSVRRFIFSLCTYFSPVVLISDYLELLPVELSDVLGNELIIANYQKHLHLLHSVCLQVYTIYI